MAFDAKYGPSKFIGDHANHSCSLDGSHSIHTGQSSANRLSKYCSKSSFKKTSRSYVDARSDVVSVNTDPNAANDKRYDWSYQCCICTRGPMSLSLWPRCVCSHAPHQGDWWCDQCSWNAQLRIRGDPDTTAAGATESGSLHIGHSTTSSGQDKLHGSTAFLGAPKKSCNRASESSRSRSGFVDLIKAGDGGPRSKSTMVNTGDYNITCCICWVESVGMIDRCVACQHEYCQICEITKTN
jgi:hypothetical protein